MEQMHTALERLRSLVGQELGPSAWRQVSQPEIDRFAELTDDHQFIHMDPERARAETPFGGTVAHGFLTLALLGGMGAEVLPRLEGARMGVNYGFDRIRFLAPVRAGARVRARFRLLEVTPRGERELLTRYAVTIEIEGEPKPALAAEWLTLSVLG